MCRAQTPPFRVLPSRPLLACFFSKPLTLTLSLVLVVVRSASSVCLLILVLVVEKWDCSRGKRQCRSVPEGVHPYPTIARNGEDGGGWDGFLCAFHHHHQRLVELWQLQAGELWWRSYGGSFSQILRSGGTTDWRR